MKNNLIQIKAGSFLESSLTYQNSKPNYLKDFYEWYNVRLKDGFFKIDLIPFSELDKWTFTENKDAIVHDSGKFFRIEGVRVKTNFGLVSEWDQPIINQPEIGILGIITKIVNGIRFFLMQTKMEPGNVNVLQLSPTLQATKSNFTKVHKGKTPEYLEFFTDRKLSKVLIDQLQTEQGARFLKKRNRNMVVEVSTDVDLKDDFKWLTLAEIKDLLTHDNIVNMDARSVISTISLIDEDVKHSLQELNLIDMDCISINNHLIEGFGFELLKSICTYRNNYKSQEELISWVTQQRVNFELGPEKIPLSQLKNWQISNDRIFNSDLFFSVIAVKVSTGTREIASWTQPLISDKNVGLLGFIAKKLNGVLHFLVQAKVEPGNIDIVELSPTVSCSNFEFVVKSKKKIPFVEYFYPENIYKIHFSAIQSEEGGRFYHMQNKNMIIEVPSNEISEIPENYCWMTLNQMMDFMKFGMFNIEARSIISSLKFI